MEVLRRLTRGFARRDQFPLEPLEREFVTITLELFDFLVSEWDFRSKMEGAGTFEITVSFLNRNVAIEIMLVEESWIVPKVVPLIRGKAPSSFDSELSELYTGFPMEMFFEVVDKSWQRPEHRKIADRQDIRDELASYATELRTYGHPLRVGDQAVMDLMQSRMRNTLIAKYATDWGVFVERVRTGFDGPITDFVSGVVARSQLESFLTKWGNSRIGNPTEQIERLDRAELRRARLIQRR